MIDWLSRLLGCQRKRTSGPEVAAAIAKRDATFVGIGEAVEAAKDATQEVDRVQGNLLKDYEDAERARLGRA